jgi:hypothetical protein
MTNEEKEMRLTLLKSSESDKTQKIKDLRFVLGTLDRVLTLGYLDGANFIKEEASISYQIIVDILNKIGEEK